MKARQMIEGAAFGPEILATITLAFDQAWAEVETRITTPQAKEVARLVLAKAILSIATEGSRDPKSLRRYGLKILLQEYPWLADDP
jgi:hypothetical protein